MMIAGHYISKDYLFQMVTLEPDDEDKLKFHPAAELFPLLSGEAAEKFERDLQINGLRSAIILFRDEEGNLWILDGRNRFICCMNIGVERRYVLYLGKDPLDYVISANVHRRDLITAQKADAVLKMANMPWGGDRTSDESKVQSCTLLTLEEAALKMGIGVRTVKQLKKIRAIGIEELNKAIDVGTVSPNAGETLLEAAPDELRTALATGDEDIIRNLAKKVKQVKQQKRQQQEQPEHVKPEFGISPVPSMPSDISTLPQSAPEQFTPGITPTPSVLSELYQSMPKQSGAELLPQVSETNRERIAESLRRVGLSPETQKKAIENPPEHTVPKRSEVGKKIDAGEADGRWLEKMAKEVESWLEKIPLLTANIEKVPSMVKSVYEETMIVPKLNQLRDAFKGASATCESTRLKIKAARDASDTE